MANSRFYKNHGPFTLGDLAKKSGATLVGADTHEVHDIATLTNATENDISFCHRRDQLQNLKSTKARAVITNPQYKDHIPDGCYALLSDAPYKSYATIARIFYPEIENAADPSVAIHPSVKIGKNCKFGYGVVIHANAEIGDNTHIDSHVVIGYGVSIGNNCVIQAGAHISHAIIGNHVEIHPGAGIGQSGFGFVMDTTGPVDIPQLGCVIIGDNVRIGANTTIDKGSLEDTIIGQHSRIDNLVQIAHNVKIGTGCIIVAQVGIAGSTVIGDFTAMGGQAGLADHLKIGSRVRIAAQGGVLQDLPDGVTVGGSPCVPVMDWHRQTIALKKLIQKKGSDS